MLGYFCQSTDCVGPGDVLGTPMHGLEEGAIRRYYASGRGL